LGNQISTVITLYLHINFNLILLKKLSGSKKTARIITSPRSNKPAGLIMKNFSFAGEKTN
jgi:hypothetical protein